MKNSLKHKLKFDYENLHENPSPELWERLENKLGGKKQTPKITFGFWKYAAVILLLITFSAIIYINKKTISIEKQIAQKSQRRQEHIEKNTQQPSNINIEKSETVKVLKKEKFVKIEPKNIENKIVKQNQNIKYQTKIAESNTPEIVLKKDEVFLPKQPENKDVLAEIKPEKTNTKYVKSEDLLFGRELEKASLEQENSNTKLGKTDSKMKKVKSIEILGITVYSEEKK